MFYAEVIGNLGADVVIRDHNGQKFASFRVADTYKFKKDDGTEQSMTQWIDCTMQNVEAEVLKYLKRGVKVFVRGRCNLRVYSSPKERKMMAGASIFVQQVELCGGSSDDVPRQIIDPDTALIHNVQKYYWTDPKPFNLKKGEVKQMLDAHGGQYVINNQGFIALQTERETTQTEAQ